MQKGVPRGLAVYVGWGDGENTRKRGEIVEVGSIVLRREKYITGLFFVIFGWRL